MLPLPALRRINASGLRHDQPERNRADEAIRDRNKNQNRQHRTISLTADDAETGKRQESVHESHESTRMGNRKLMLSYSCRFVRFVDLFSYPRQNFSCGNRYCPSERLSPRRRAAKSALRVVRKRLLAAAIVRCRSRFQTGQEQLLLQRNIFRLVRPQFPFNFARAEFVVDDAAQFRLRRR